MKKNFFAIFVMVFVASMLFSCEDDYVTLSKTPLGKLEGDTLILTDTLIQTDTLIVMVPDTIKLDSAMYQQINGIYTGVFNARVCELYAETSSVTGEIETYASANNQLITTQEFELPLQFNALMSAPKRTYVKTPEALSKVNLQNASENAAVLTDKNYNKFLVRKSSKNYSFSFDNGERIVVNSVYESSTYADTLNFDYSSINDVSYMGADAVETINNADSIVYDVTMHFNVEVQRHSFDASEPSAETYLVDVPYQKVYLIEKTFVGYTHEEEVVLENGDLTAHVVVYAVYSNGSREEIKNDKVSMTFDFNEPADLDMLVTNTNFATVANGANSSASVATNGCWSFERATGVYSSTASNGTQSFDNDYSFVYDSKVTYTYGDVVVTFNGQMSLVEGSTTLQEQGAQGDYTLYNYVNNVIASYTVNGQTVSKSGKAVRTLRVENPKVTSESWGTIIGAGISAVPMDPTSDQAQYCLCVRTTNGAVAVPFAIGSQPTVNQVLGGYFATGSFGASYNSGYYTTAANKGSYPAGVWAPAVARDEANMIVYSSNGNDVRCISKATLARNGWRGGNYSTVVDGYSFAVSANGTLTVSYNGTEIMRIR